MTKNMKLGLGLGITAILIIAIFFVQKAVLGIMQISAASLNAVGIETDQSFNMVPAKVTGLTGGMTDGNVVLNWKPLKKSKLNGYRIYRGNSRGAELIIGSSTSSGFVDSNIKKGETYYYRVSAINDLGEGALSSTISVIVK